MTSTPSGLVLVVPVLNESAGMPALLNHLQHWHRRGACVVVVDGGSTDDSVAQARAYGFRVLTTAPGRARQMNAGARAEPDAPALVFLHADTRLPTDADTRILQALAGQTLAWGRFDVHIEGRSCLLPLVAGMMNRRSRLTGVATGDQALFMTRTAYEAVGGFPEQPLMEDVEMSKQLKRHRAPVCLRARVTTSGRRWDTRGAWRTIWLMWRLRWAYWRGVPAQQLAERYQ